MNWVKYEHTLKQFYSDMYIYYNTFSCYAYFSLSIIMIVFWMCDYYDINERSWKHHLTMHIMKHHFC